MTDTITIRVATNKDAKSLLQIHYDAIHQIAAKDYPTDILDIWAPRICENRITQFIKNPDNEIRLIAEIERKPVGFGAIVIELNELRACYVSSRALGRGVGRALITELEKIAADHKRTYLKLDSSITAKKFYTACGYQTITHSTHPLNNGTQEMKCIKMRKFLK
jgi:putative acetyltransferase